MNSEKETVTATEDGFNLWFDVFKPIKNHLDVNSSFNNRMFETYGAELDFVRAEAANTIWTMVDCGDSTVIQAGYHYVNRIGYFISSVPFTDAEFDMEIVFSRDESDLKSFRVMLHEDKGDKFQIAFDCMATEADDADTQAINAYPNGEVLSCTQLAPSITHFALMLFRNGKKEMVYYTSQIERIAGLKRLMDATQTLHKGEPIQYFFDYNNLVAAWDGSQWLVALYGEPSYVIYSPSEDAGGNDEGFWSNEDGWVTKDDATRFSFDEIQTLNLPASSGNDARINQDVAL